MVKELHITLEDKEHKKLTEIKQRRALTWKELLLRVMQVLK